VLTITRTGAPMNQCKRGKRVVVLGRTPPTKEGSHSREPTHPQAPIRRIVLIKNGEVLASKPGR
jgi:hypothetical protein